MLTILYYCLKVIFCSAVLLGYYRLALRNNRFHQWNRYYLLAATVLPFVLPLMKISIPFSTAEETPLLVRGVEMVGMPDLFISELNATHRFQFTWQFAVTGFYVLVVVFLAMVFVKNIIKIQKLKLRYPCEFIDGIAFYNTQEQGTPFSFFRTIFWNKRIALNSEKGQQMLAHELAHVNEKHSTDKVFMEVLIALAWWNPVLYFIRRELSVIHEFIADKKASAGDENLQYASLLLMKAMGHEQFALANPFFHSQLKRRFAMLTTSTNPKFSYVRRLMVMPLAAFALFLFSFKYKELREQGVLNAPEPLTVIIDAGHGGADNGVVTANGIKEDAISLQLAQKIKALSEGTNINVILTRNTDSLPGNTTNKDAALRYRTNLAKENNADFFISLHMNSDDSKAAIKQRGIEAFVSNNNSMLNKQSRVIASGFLDEISGHGLPVASILKTRSGQNIYVLEQNTVPSVLLELGYITNPVDAAFMQQPKNQETLAKDILNALAKHGKKAKETVALDLQEVELKEIPLSKYYGDSIKLKLVEKKTSGIVKIQVTKDSIVEKNFPKTISVTVDENVNGEVKNVIVNTNVNANAHATIKTMVNTNANANVQTNVNANPNINANANVNVNAKVNASVNTNVNTNFNANTNVNIQLHEKKGLDINSEVQPLYVLDGVIKDKTLLNELNPGDIESITVLKGESATKLYGDGGKNGVILIYSKQAPKVPVTLNIIKEAEKNKTTKSLPN
ncbi:MAG: N-acetylmuramoyl-L-alanine amidase [Bacteroidota bacterium]